MKKHEKEILEFMLSQTEGKLLVMTGRAAELIGSTCGNLQVMRCQNRGPAYHQIGRCVRYNVRDLASYIAQGRVEPRNA